MDQSRVLQNKGYQQLTSLASVATLTVPAGAKYALLQAETQDVRFRNDGTDPTATVGMILEAGVQPLFFAGDLAGLEFIETAASAKLNVIYLA